MKEELDAHKCDGRTERQGAILWNPGRRRVLWRSVPVFASLSMGLMALAPLGAMKADVVTLKNLYSGSSNPKVNSNSLVIHFVTNTAGGAFQLGTLNLFGFMGIDTGVSYFLRNSSSTNSIVNGITGTGDMTNGSLVLSSNPFGSGTYWLEITGLDRNYLAGNSSTLGGGNFGVSNGTEVAFVGGIPANDAVTGNSIYQTQLTVNVPEPATMILTGAALVAGAIGVFFIRRQYRPQRKRQLLTDTLGNTRSNPG